MPTSFLALAHAECKDTRGPYRVARKPSTTTSVTRSANAGLYASIAWLPDQDRLHFAHADVLPRGARFLRGAQQVAEHGQEGVLGLGRGACDIDAESGQRVDQSYFGPDGFAQQQGYPKVVASSDKSHDIDLQHRLWAVSEELTAVVYPVG